LAQLKVSHSLTGLSAVERENISKPSTVFHVLYNISCYQILFASFVDAVKYREVCWLLLILALGKGRVFYCKLSAPNTVP